MSEDQGQGAVDLAKVEGESKIDESVGIEIDLLSTIVVDRIASSIALQTARALAARDASTPIVLASADAVSRLGAARLLREELASVSDAMASHLEIRGGFEVAAVAPASIAGLIGGVAELMSWLQVDTTWTGRQSEMGAALLPSLAGKFIAAGRRVVVLEDMQFRSDVVGAFVASVQRLRQRRSELAAEIEAARQSRAWLSAAGALVAAADAWLGTISPPASGEASKLASAVALSFGLDSQVTLVLSATVMRAGGHYRVRRHLFSTLFGNGGISCFAGAIVTFQLLDLQTGHLLLSDTAHAATGHVRFLDPPSRQVPLSSFP